MSFFHALLAESGIEYADHLISGGTLDIFNRYIDVNFDPDAYHSSGGAVVASDLQVVFVQNGGVATACSISSITRQDGTALQGGENLIRVNLSITGNPSGVEEITIKPTTQGTIKDSLGRYIAGSSSTTKTLYLKLDSWYQTGLITMLTNSFSVPELPQRLIHNAWFVSCRTDGSLTEWDGIHLLDFSSSMARINFVTGTLQGSITGSPVFTIYVGMHGAVGGYLDAGWSPNSGTKYLQNDGSLMALVSTDGQSAGRLMGVRGGASANLGHSRLQVRNASDLAVGNINHNNAGNSTSGACTNAVGTHHVSREASNLVNYYLRGSFLDDGATTSSTRSTRNLYIGTANLDGTADTPDQVHDIMIACYGAGQQDQVSNIHTRNETYRTAMTALVPSFSGRFYVMMGQSNADQSQDLLTALTSGEAALYNNGPMSIANGYAANVYDWNENTGAWEFLEAGVNGVNIGTNYFGPAYPYMYAETLKHAGEDLFLVRYAIGGTGMYNSSGGQAWKPGGNSQTIFERAMTKISNALAAMASVTQYMKIYWWQGEKDGADVDDANEYEANEALFTAAVRARFSGFSSASFIVTKPHEDSPQPYITTIRGAKDDNLATGTVYGSAGALINVDDLTLNGHLLASSCITAAQRASAQQY